MTIKVDVSVGEFLDKVTILEIKSERIKDQAKLENVNKELTLMKEVWNKSEFAKADISDETDRLKKINEKIWEIEDNIRDKERDRNFDEGFVELARSVYYSNDERANIKKELNLKLGSGLVEEKSYSDYQQAG